MNLSKEPFPFCQAYCFDPYIDVILKYNSAKICDIVLAALIETVTVII